MTKGALLRVVGWRQAFKYDRHGSQGDVFVFDSERKFRCFKRDSVGPLCSDCTTRHDEFKKLPNKCPYCDALREKALAGKT